MASRISYLVVLAAWIAALWWGLDFAARQKAPPVAIPTAQVDWAEFFAANILPSLPVADEFDTPLRPPDGAGATVTLPFLYAGQHLGEDWATAKGDAALGEPVYSVADGWVSVAQDFENAWGKVVFICYRMPEGRWPPFVEVMYAELNSIDGQAGRFREARPADRHGRQCERDLSRPTCTGRCDRPSGWGWAPASARAATAGWNRAILSPPTAATGPRTRCR